jgi:hypothetical protein
MAHGPTRHQINHMGESDGTRVMGTPGHRCMVLRPIEGPLQTIPILLSRNTSEKNQRNSRLLPTTLQITNAQPDTTRRNRRGRTIRITCNYTKEQKKTTPSKNRQTTESHRRASPTTTSKGDRTRQPECSKTEGGHPRDHKTHPPIQRHPELLPQPPGPTNARPVTIPQGAQRILNENMLQSFANHRAGAQHPLKKQMHQYIDDCHVPLRSPPHQLPRTILSMAIMFHTSYHKKPSTISQHPQTHNYGCRHHS